MQQHVKPPREFDTIEMEVYSNRFMSITDEMGLSLVRSSFSTNIKERKDCSVGLFDGRGRLIVQASHIPVHLGSLQEASRRFSKTTGSRISSRVTHSSATTPILPVVRTRRISRS